MTVLIVIVIYLASLLALGVLSSRFFRGTSKDYFVASQSIGPFLLLMSVFGTTMTAFALVGSTGKSFERGIGVYGLMASSSGLLHAACFFLIGIRLWAFGKKYGYVTQIQFFRARFDSNGIGYLLFPILVGLVIPYLLIGVIGAGKTMQPATAGAFPELFSHPSAALNGGIPPWLSGLVICGIVLVYIFMGGSRGAAWANTFQTLVFMIMGLVAFLLIVNSLGGLSNASKVTAQVNDKGEIVQPFRFDKEKHELVKNEPPRVIGRLHDSDGKEATAHLANGGDQPHLARSEREIEFDKRNPKTKEKIGSFTREVGIPPLMFLTYMFIPLSVGMFPHLFQHWLTAKSAKTFRLTLVAHPLFIMIVWVPCVLIGSWATGILPALPPDKLAAVLSFMFKTLVENKILVGLLTAGVLAAIMSSLDSQFLCMGTIFTNDIVLHASKKGRYTDKQIVWLARGFTIGIVVLTYTLAMIMINYNVFDLAVWCFSGFAGLFPLVFASLYWKRATKAGAYASIIAMAATWFYFFQAAGFGGEYTVLGGVMPAAFCFAACAIAMIVVSLLTKPPSAETVEKFFPKALEGEPCE